MAKNAAARTHHPPRPLFERFAGATTRATGHAWAFISAFSCILVWAGFGPMFHFSETWQIVINTGTTIVTFLMVFLIQHSQNKDNIAIQLKLNELLASQPTASNRVVAIENLGDAELEQLARFYTRLADLAQKEHGVKHSHSLDEAERSHQRKHTRQKQQQG